MMLGARTGAWSGGAKMPTIYDYVSDSMLNNFDGIVNAGIGVDRFEGPATSWKNLKQTDRLYNHKFTNIGKQYCHFDENSLVCESYKGGTYKDSEEFSIVNLYGLGYDKYNLFSVVFIISNVVLVG